MRWRERIMRFMAGRYGTDQLNRTLIIVSFINMLLSMFVLRPVFYTIGLIFLLINMARTFSKNHQARYKENQWYLGIENKIRQMIRNLKYQKDNLKHYHIYKCPSCKQKIRIPRGKGKIMVRCPKCETEFMKKS